MTVFAWTVFAAVFAFVHCHVLESFLTGFVCANIVDTRVDTVFNDDIAPFVCIVYLVSLVCFVFCCGFSLFLQSEGCL